MVKLMSDKALLDWLSAAENPAVRYLSARDLGHPRRSARALAAMRRDTLNWAPLRKVLARQQDDGSFPHGQKTSTAQPTFWALLLMERCGLDLRDEPVTRAMDYLEKNHAREGALSYLGGGSGILPCYIGVVTRALIKMGGLELPLVQTSLRWLVDHQRFDHKSTRAGGAEPWPYKSVQNYGCWQTVSCYHGVAGALRAMAAVPTNRRSPELSNRMAAAIAYLRIHRVYKTSRGTRPLFRHMTQFFILGDYRSDLVDVLEALAEADPRLIREDWVREAVDAVEKLTDGGRVPLVKNYGKKLIDPLPVERVGEPSRFLTFQWLVVKRQFGLC
ncbi:MAG: terpene cyclase/mutase family protein [Deltaproteobacteria bacterium]|nr:terpene cyclase/mutase family protein [Deltaproteobacteria bacterium]